MRGLGTILFLALALWPATSFAQDDGGEELICTLAAHGWGGTDDEVRRVDEEPVPPSFREIFEGDGCDRFQLIENSLLTWHLHLGNEASTIAAAEYYERHKTPQLIDPDRLETQLQNAWAEAWPTLQQTAALYGSSNFREANRLRLEAPDMAALNALARKVKNHRFMANIWLSGARFFDSPTMLRRAEPHMAVMTAFDRFFSLIAEQHGTLGRYGIENAYEWETGYRLQTARYGNLRAALLGDFSARATRPEADLSDAQYDLEDYVQDQRPLNQIDHQTPGAEYIYEELQNQSNWVLDQLLLWTEYAYADLLRQEPPARYERRCDSRQLFNAKAGLLALERQSYGSDRIYRLGRFGLSSDFRHARIALLLAQVTCHQTASDNAIADNDPETAHGALVSVLQGLAEIRLLLQPDEAPTRFRQIASRYLAGLDQCRELIATLPVRGSGCTHGHDRQLEVYFRRNLDALDDIVIGAERIEDG